MRVVTTGTFDIPHLGHAVFLRKAALLGDHLVVGVLSDEFVEQYKGALPVYTQKQRWYLVTELGYTAHIVSNQELFFTTQGADVIAVGSDWARKDYYAQIGMSQDELDRLGITLAYVPYTGGISTTDIKDRLDPAA